MDERTEQPLFPISPEEAQADGHGSDVAAHSAGEGQRRLQVFSAIGEFMKGRRKRHGR